MATVKICDVCEQPKKTPLWNDACPCGHDWERHSISDGGCGADWEYDGPDPGIPSKHGCMCQLAHTDRSKS